MYIVTIQSIIAYQPILKTQHSVPELNTVQKKGTGLKYWNYTQPANRIRKRNQHSMDCLVPTTKIN